MSGNLREWTTEVYYANILDDTDDSSNTISNTTTDEEIEVQENSYRVVRGGSANINKVANSRIGELESLSDAYWGFRIVLYKE
jgi:formylglycine-generating enzyme required for sulfatase activity